MIRQMLLLSAVLVFGSSMGALAAGRPQASAASLAVPPGQIVIYSNLGPGGLYDPWDSWCVYVNPFPPANPALCAPSPQAVAMAFTGNGGFVTQIDLGLTWEGSGTSTATVQLATDTGYPVPTKVLGSWPLANLPLTHACPCGLVTVHVSPAIPVAAG